MQISVGKINYKVIRRNKVFLAMASLAIAVVAFTIWRPSTPVKGSWQPINKLLPQSFTEKLIDKHAKINSQLSIDAISATSEAQQLPVEDWVAVRFNKRELCSLAGCLNLIVDKKEKTEIAILSLYDQDDRNQFMPSTRKDCLIGIQTMQGRVLNQEFCKH
jgi:hypothetical protein